VTAPIEDVSSLPGKKVIDQQESTIGKITEIYAMDGDGHPMWVAVDASFGGDKRSLLIPLARLKDEQGDLLVPYSKDHLSGAPEVDTSDGVSEEADRELRGFYGIGLGDQELRDDNKSYATLVPEEGAAKQVEDASELETPDPDKRTDETRERLHGEQRRESRGATGSLLGDEDTGGGDDDTSGDDDDASGGDDTSAGDDETTGGDDTTAGDHEASGDDDNTSAGDDDGATDDDRE
jgi:hypothetical protein